MRGSAFLVLVAAVASAIPSTAADPPLVDGVSGAPLTWSDWIAKRGPVAILVWASWAPEAQPVLEQHESLTEASRKAGLNFILLDVQESLEDARAALEGSGVSWVHDRHGALLKRYRVIKVPSILVVSPDGTVRSRHDATPEALAGGLR